MITEQGYLEAVRAGERESDECGARGVRYDEDAGVIVVELAGDMLLTFPPKSVQGLENATTHDLRSIQLSPSRLGLHIERLDWDISIPGLVAGRTGSQKWMASDLGRAGGLVKTFHKSEAARQNGKLGGRPKRPD